MYNLNNDTCLNFRNVDIFVYAFTLTYIDDISQQQKNAKFFNQKIILKCRFCFVFASKRVNIEYDIVNNNRYHYETLRMRKKMNFILIKSKRNIYNIKIELNIDDSFLITIFFVLNIIRTKFNDFVHFEYVDIIQLLHIFLIKIILIVSFQKKYTQIFRKFSFFF